MRKFEEAAIRTAIKRAKRGGIQKGIEFIRNWSRKMGSSNPDIKGVLLQFSKKMKEEKEMKIVPIVNLNDEIIPFKERKIV